MFKYFSTFTKYLCILGLGGAALVFLLSTFKFIQNHREAAARAVTMNNLKNIGFACRSYHDFHKCWPAPKLFIEKGDTNLSWRVSILPMLDHQALFEDFDLTAGWDGSANVVVQKQKPSCFESPYRDWRSQRETRFQYLTGPGTLFPDRSTRSKADIKDNASLTFLIAEADQPVIWSRPGDMIIHPDQPLPIASGPRFLAIMADGSCIGVANGWLKDSILRQLINPSDGEPANSDDLYGP